VSVREPVTVKATSGGKRRVRTKYFRKYRPPIERPPLSYYQILAWADAHNARTGRWPTMFSGKVPEANCENWCAIHAALTKGYRGLPGGCTLVQLLANARGVRNKKAPPPLRPRQILNWAYAHRACHGRWPTRTSGEIPGSGGETWACVNRALSLGLRKLRGGTTLSSFLRGRNHIANPERATKLSLAQVLVWADEYFAAHGRWPDINSGAIPKSRGERWRGINLSLTRARRGLPGPTSLAELFAARRTPGLGERAPRGAECAKGAFKTGLPASASSPTWP
jgi:hypothetical protein